jgi:hypothetical protein
MTVVAIKYVAESQCMTKFIKILQNTNIFVYSPIHVITIYNHSLILLYKHMTKWGKKHRLIDIFVIYGMFVAKVVIINKTINLTGT